MTSTTDTREKRFEEARRRVARAWDRLYAAERELHLAAEAMWRNGEAPRDAMDEPMTSCRAIDSEFRNLGA